MNKHHAKAFTLLLLVLFIGLTTSVWGAETDNYGNGEYALTRYHVAIEVNEDNSFLITEEIKAHFLVSKHGIIRGAMCDVTFFESNSRLEPRKTMFYLKILPVSVFQM